MSRRRIGFLLALFLAGCERLPGPSGAPRTDAPAAATTAVATATIPALPPPEPRPAAPAVGEATLEKAAALGADNQWQQARELLQPLADAPEAPEKVLARLGEINTRILLSPAPAPEKVDYTIAAGDSLGKIAKAHHTTVELLKRANNLTGDLIRVGDRLRIYQGEFAVAVDKSANTLTLTDRGKFFKRYRVGTGEYAKTPAGDFQITTRIKDPPWWRGDRTIPFGDPANILGTHWLGLNVTGYGIHGTWDTNAIGHQSTAGCIRLLNDDVAELYAILPSGTPVRVRD